VWLENRARSRESGRGKAARPPARCCQQRSEQADDEGSYGEQRNRIRCKRSMRRAAGRVGLKLVRWLGVREDVPHKMVKCFRLSGQLKSVVQRGSRSQAAAGCRAPAAREGCPHPSGRGSVQPSRPRARASPGDFWSLSPPQGRCRW